MLNLSYTPKAPFKVRECLALFDPGSLNDDGEWHELTWETNPQLRLTLAGPFVTEEIDNLDNAEKVLSDKSKYLRGMVGRKYYDDFIISCGGSPEPPSTGTELMCCFKCFDMVEYSAEYMGAKRVVARAVPVSYKFRDDGYLDTEYEIMPGPWRDIIWNRDKISEPQIDAHWSPIPNLKVAFEKTGWEQFQVLPEPADEFCSPLYRCENDDGSTSVGVLMFQNLLGCGAFDPMPLFLRPVIYHYLEDTDEEICVLHETFINNEDCIGATEIINLSNF